MGVPSSEFSDFGGTEVGTTTLDSNELGDIFPNSSSLLGGGTRDPKFPPNNDATNYANSFPVTQALVSLLSTNSSLFKNCGEFSVLFLLYQ